MLYDQSNCGYPSHSNCASNRTRRMWVVLVGWVLGGLLGGWVSGNWKVKRPIIIYSTRQPRRRRPRKQESYAAADPVRSVTALRFVYFCFAFPTQSDIAVRRCTHRPIK